MCPAGGRDGQGVSLLCHPATHACIYVTALKLWRRGGYSPCLLSPLLSAPPPPGRNGDEEEGALNWRSSHGSRTPSFPPPPHLLQKQHPNQPSRPLLLRSGLGIDQRPARPLVASERSQGRDSSRSARASWDPPSPAILTYRLTSLSALEEDRGRGVNALCPGQLSWQAVPPDL